MLFDKLNEYSQSGVYPMHMPGHKRNVDFFKTVNPYSLDITEIDGFDNLHDAEGILKDGMEQLAALYGSAKSFYLVNGSSGGLIAGIAACVKKGDKVLIARNCHKAVYHAVELLDLNPVYLIPPVIEEYGIAGSMIADEIKKALSENPDIKLIVITSPTYEGIVSDIKSISEIAHSRNIPLLVDEAHGAHLGFSESFPKSAVQCGADIVVQSFHKTLPSFTQTAVIHFNSDIVELKNLQHQLRVFQTSSPSYLFMISIDNCVELLAKSAAELFKAYEDKLFRFGEKMKELNRLEVLFYGNSKMESSDVYAFDPGKLVVSTRKTRMTGAELSETLLKKYKIQLEMSSGNYAIAMTSFCDTDEGFERLSDALIEIDSLLKEENKELQSVIKFPVPEVVKAPGEIRCSDGEFIKLDSAKNKISKEFVFAYPPGIPLLAPGERVTDEFLNQCKIMMNHGVCLHSESGNFPNLLEILKEEQ